MVVDSSAIFTIVLGERMAEDCRLALRGDDQLYMSAATVAEVGIVATMKGVVADTDKLVESLELRVVAVDQVMAERTIDAHRRFGKGQHPARLNYGDCFSYALAKELKAPLLFIGNDFSQTDIESVL